MRIENCITCTRQAIYWLLYFGLTGAGFLFVQNTLREFLNKKTDFHTDSASLMTAKDIPTPFNFNVTAYRINPSQNVMPFSLYPCLPQLLGMCCKDFLATKGHSLA